MNKDDHIIWSNNDLDYDDWQEELRELYPELSENERVEKMYEINADYLCDERINLDIQVGTTILAIGDLGRWNGRFMGYKEIPSGNIRDCLFSDADYLTWYVDKTGEFRCDAVHHDGTDYMYYRKYKRGVGMDKIEDLKHLIYSGRATEADIDAVTEKLGRDIGRVYGWHFPEQKRNRSEPEAR